MANDDELDCLEARGWFVGRLTVGRDKAIVAVDKWVRFDDTAHDEGMLFDSSINFDFDLFEFYANITKGEGMLFGFSFSLAKGSHFHPKRRTRTLPKLDLF